MLVQYVLGELGIEALAYAQNSVRSLSLFPIISLLTVFGF